MFSKILKASDWIHFGWFNATQVNRNCIIRFRPKLADGSYGRQVLIRANKMAEIMGDGEPLKNIVRKLDECMDERLVVKNRNKGEFVFVIK